MPLKGFVEGGIASIVAGCSTHPLDLIKVRMQLQGEASTNLRSALAFPHSGSGSITIPAPKPGPISVGAQILRSEGFPALFSGVSATVLRQTLYSTTRQTLYSTTRMGLYDLMKTKWTDSDGHFPLRRKIAAGLRAGGISGSAPQSATPPTSLWFACKTTAASPSPTAATTNPRESHRYGSEAH